MSDNEKDSPPEKKKTSVDKVLMGMVIGGAIGSVIGAVVAPKKGKETREDIAKQATIFKKGAIRVAQKIAKFAQLFKKKK